MNLTLFIDFNRKNVAGSEASLFEQVIEDDDFYAYCADEFVDYIEELSPEAKSYVEGLEKDELIYSLLPDEIQCEIENILFDSWVNDHYEIIEIDDDGFPVE